ncbi:MAG: ECF-type sigma factor [Planctomycetota bacterium]|jgi:RNA polymerase sigma factor (TIGR02999 family)
MPVPEPTDATLLLEQSSEGRREAADKLMLLVYDELHALAHRQLGREASELTLQTTALVHEAYLRLIDQRRVEWKGRTHFYAIGAQALRRALVDHARGRKREKRGGGRMRLELKDDVALDRGRSEDVLAVDEALDRLAALDARQARIVELRFFGQLDVAAVAEEVGVSKRTVEADWTAAKAWLRREIAREQER